MSNVNTQSQVPGARILSRIHHCENRFLLARSDELENAPLLGFSVNPSQNRPRATI